jgi:bilirubin oxidase
MKFVVDVALSGEDESTAFEDLSLPAFTRLGPAKRTRQVALLELDSEALPDTGPMEARLGTVKFMDGMPTGMPMMWADPVTEMPILNEEEIWEIYNFTMDAHPMHIHEVMFEVVDRQPFKIPGGKRPPESWETGFKDTVTAYPGEITRLKARFDHPGLFVWHCHIVDHEDNEMMRPLRVVRQYHIPLITIR